MQAAADLKQTVYTTMLDASKAFDVVSNNNLLIAMLKHNIKVTHWDLMKDWYTGMTSEVKWDGILSRTISEEQGLRQGGGLSAGQYKTYTNDNLVNQKEQALGLKIGTTYIGCPTCADDTALVHSNQQRFEFSKTKTRILIHDSKPQHKSVTVKTPYWQLDGADITVTQKQDHLGIPRESNKLVMGKEVAESRFCV